MAEWALSAAHQASPEHTPYTLVRSTNYTFQNDKQWFFFPDTQDICYTRQDDAAGGCCVLCMFVTFLTSIQLDGLQHFWTTRHCNELKIAHKEFAQVLTIIIMRVMMMMQRQCSLCYESSIFNWWKREIAFCRSRGKYPNQKTVMQTFSKWKKTHLNELLLKTAAKWLMWVVRCTLTSHERNDGGAFHSKNCDSLMIASRLHQIHKPFVVITI